MDGPQDMPAPATRSRRIHSSCAVDIQRKNNEEQRHSSKTAILYGPSIAISKRRNRPIDIILMIDYPVLHDGRFS
jgi:hypothetical protein